MGADMGALADGSLGGDGKKIRLLDSYHRFNL